MAPGSAKYGSGVPKDDGSSDLGPRGGTGRNVDIPSGPNRPNGPAATTVSGAPIDDTGSLGRNTRLYLSREVPRLVVEIDAVKDFGPTTYAMDTLRERLTQIADKPGGIDLLQPETIANGKSRLTRDDLIELEKRNRDHYSSKDVMVLYVLYVNGVFADDTEALGVAYEASAFAVFQEQIREAAATPLVPAISIEEAVIVHEMGHVLALVNIGYTSPRNHEDAEHPNHSSNANSVMYWAIDNVGIANLLQGRPTPPNKFDTNDLADLSDLKTGRLRVG
ncbi:MAG TPA: hypothetical protein VFA34_16285 [Actinomycetota bacterium]|nr:hypothetical protein [Actinomycetota bacterium]